MSDFVKHFLLTIFDVYYTIIKKDTKYSQREEWECEMESSVLSVLR